MLPLLSLKIFIVKRAHRCNRHRNQRRRIQRPLLSWRRTRNCKMKSGVHVIKFKWFTKMGPRLIPDRHIADPRSWPKNGYVLSYARISLMRLDCRLYCIPRNKVTVLPKFSNFLPRDSLSFWQLSVKPLEQIRKTVKINKSHISSKPN